MTQVENENRTYKLSDDAIVAIARLLQVAILTGTDITDNLRLFSLEANGDMLRVTSEYMKNFDAGIESLMEKVKENLDSKEASSV